MRMPFDFGISQEDPLTEQKVLDIHPGDRILSVASGGEVPLSLLSINDGIHISAVDTSQGQIMLCRLKMLTALHVGFPENSRFLGYSPMKNALRYKIFKDYILPHLNADEASFWKLNRRYIEEGVAGQGRFEIYIRKMRFAAGILVGKKNLQSLISAGSLPEQYEIFEKRIATRQSLQLLFKVVFHPSLYRKRGLQEQALIHARKDTGQRFYRRFEDFCTGTRASSNYFLQYFLTGQCHTGDSYPEYLKPENRNRLISNVGNLELRQISFNDMIAKKGHGFFNKIHFSNLGDWLEKDDFAGTMRFLKDNCQPGTLICYRYLQKDHLAYTEISGISVDRTIAERVQKEDRFPFYTTYLLTIGDNST